MGVVSDISTLVKTAVSVDLSRRVSPVDFARRSATATVMAATVAVFAGDLFFAAVRAYQLFSKDIANNNWHLDVDGSYPELYQYVKFGVIAVLTAALARVDRWYLVWTAVFGFFLLDDALLIHERLGEQLAPGLDSMLPIDGQATAELGYFAVIGMAILVAAFLAVNRSSDAFRRFSIDIVMLLALGAFFAVGVDVVHGMLTLNYEADTLFSTVEDGGEMVAVSLMVIYSVMVAERRGDPVHWIHEIRRTSGS